MVQIQEQTLENVPVDDIVLTLISVSLLGIRNKRRKRLLVRARGEIQKRIFYVQ